ncbi:MAG: hypothetical protein ABI683_14880 [Ginsengibacter sp.]
MKNFFNYSFFLVLLMSCGFSDNFTRDINLYESTSNYLPRNFKKILICGTGDAATRLFVEKLSDKLNARFTSKSIEGGYLYLGDEGWAADSALFQFRKEGTYDGYLFFFQKDLQTSASDQLLNSKKGKRNFDEFLGIKLFDAVKNNKQIWEANLKVNSNLTDEKFYSDVSAIIIKRFSENKILK